MLTGTIGVRQPAYPKTCEHPIDGINGSQIKCHNWSLINVMRVN
jgi:hypothetical protein